jgi:hypothetical protein
MTELTERELEQVISDVEGFGRIEASDDGTLQLEIYLSGCMSGFWVYFEMDCYASHEKRTNGYRWIISDPKPKMSYNLGAVRVQDSDGGEVECSEQQIDEIGLAIIELTT